MVKSSSNVSSASVHVSRRTESELFPVKSRPRCPPFCQILTMESSRVVSDLIVNDTTDLHCSWSIICPDCALFTLLSSRVVELEIGNSETRKKMNCQATNNKNSDMPNHDDEDDDEEEDSEEEDEETNDQSHSAANYRYDYGSGSGSGHTSNGIDNLIASAPLLLSTSDTSWTNSPYYAAAILHSNGQASIPFQSMGMGIQQNNNGMGDFIDLNSYAAHAHFPLSHYPTSGSFHQPHPPPRVGKSQSQSNRGKRSRSESSGSLPPISSSSKSVAKSISADTQPIGGGQTGIKLAPPLWVYAEGTIEATNPNHMTLFPTQQKHALILS